MLRTRLGGEVVVLHQDNLVRSIDGRKKRMKGKEVERCVKALEMLQKTAKGIYRG